MSKLRKTILDMIYEVGDNSGCHQLPDRSFFYKGRQFPVCARCTGVTIGQTTALILAFFKRVLSLPCAFILLMIMGIDWSVQEFRIKESTNVRRLITGFCGGLGLFSMYLIFIRKLIALIQKNRTI